MFKNISLICVMLLVTGCSSLVGYEDDRGSEELSPEGYRQVEKWSKECPRVAALVEKRRRIYDYLTWDEWDESYYLHREHVSDRHAWSDQWKEWSRSLIKITEYK